VAAAAAAAADSAAAVAASAAHQSRVDALAAAVHHWAGAYTRSLFSST